jgi:hypothetical protein
LQRLRRVTLLVAVASLAAVGAFAALYMVHRLGGSLSVTGQPLIWYEAPPWEPPGVSVTVSAVPVSASLASTGNGVAVLYDHNTSASIGLLGYLPDIAAGGAANVSASLLLLNATGDDLLVPLRVLLVQYRYTSLGLGYYLIVVEVVDSTYVLLPNGSLIGIAREVDSYYLYDSYTNSATYINSTNQNTTCTTRLTPLAAVVLNATVLQNASTSMPRLYINGRLFCSHNASRVTGMTTYASAAYIYIGPDNATATYRLIGDRLAYWATNATTAITQRLGFDDGTAAGVYLVAFNDTAAVPLPLDGSLGFYTAPGGGGPVLETYTSLPNATTVYTMLESNISCSAAYRGVTRPVLLANEDPVDYRNATVHIVLNSTNFPDWSLLEPDGGDIYFTDASGHPIPYWIESIDTGASYASIYIRVPRLPANGYSIVYMHYGGANPYPDYNSREKALYIFYEDFTRYTSFADLLSTGRWVVVNASAIIAVNSTGLYVANGNHTFALRSVARLYPPFVLRYELAACRNQSSDWDSGVAIGWDNESEYVAFLDDIGGTSYVATFMAIAERIDQPAWTNADYINQARQDNDYTVFHTYQVNVTLGGDTFTDLSDGRNNTDDYYSSRKIVQDYGNISGYIWLVNDGDTRDNCAVYRRIEAQVNATARYYILDPLEPIVEQRIASTNGTVTGPILATGYGAATGTAGPLALQANASAPLGNLSEIRLLYLLPPGNGAQCTVSTDNPYGLSTSGDPFSLQVLLTYTGRLENP